MPRYRLSKSAANDIAKIADYTIDKFDIEQARRYRDGMIQSLEILSDRPWLGRSADELVANLKRWNYKSHIIFYSPDEFGILIVRVLHQRMDAQQHAMADE